ncbi:hypothetical protein NLI96_g8485 [Meripilus lineatus]|uniref:Uncharacterized protein n=1 Tax=Meripilus lineatus TaxID=2056292 RepID=A0AAD5UX70_9APHY|nr:hypothetical protein NLI96_g8485 [Physisporinus lineatus]
MAYASTLGAVLVGGLVAMYLSGIVSMQVILYYQVYPSDQLWMKLLVAFIWCSTSEEFQSSVNLKPTCQAHRPRSCLHGMCGGLDIHNRELWVTGPHGKHHLTTVVLTSVLTVTVHCYYVHRIWTLSNHNWFLTTPIVRPIETNIGRPFLTPSQDDLDLRSDRLLHQAARSVGQYSFNPSVQTSNPNFPGSAAQMYSHYLLFSVAFAHVVYFKDEVENLLLLPPAFRGEVTVYRSNQGYF